MLERFVGTVTDTVRSVTEPENNCETDSLERFVGTVTGSLARRNL